MDRQKVSVSEILLLVISLLFFLGSITVFAPCGPKEDGSWMTCHWAGSAVTGIAAVLTVIAIIHLVIRDRKIKAGLDIAMIPMAVLSAFVPGGLIHLCMMDTMRCHTVTRPAAMVFSVLVIAAAVLDAVKHGRKS